MGRFRRTAIGAVAVPLVLLGAACGDRDEPAPAGPAATTNPPATSPPPTPPTTVDTSNDPDLARAALIGTSALPPGAWRTDPDAGSGPDDNELFEVPSCRKLVDDADAAGAAATGRASADFVQDGDAEVRLGNSVRVYPSAATVQEFGRVVTADGFGTCFIDFLRTQQGAEGGTITGLKATPFAVDVDGVEVDFVAGLTIRFSLEFEGDAVEAAVRTVFIGSGRGVSNVVVAIFATPGQGLAADIGAIDIEPTVDAAARRLVDAMN